MDIKGFFVDWNGSTRRTENPGPGYTLQATKILGKLTEPQRVFLKGFDSDLTTTESSECGRAEFRAAVACRDKGLIAEMPASLTSAGRRVETGGGVGLMGLPDWVRAECRKEISKPTPSMKDRVDRVHAAALRCGYLHDHVTRSYVWVGEGPEPWEDPRRRSGTNAQ